MIHVALVDWAPGELQGYVDVGLLESAVVTCQQEYYKGVFMKAAALLRSLICDHPFLDGNKRTAIIAVAVFLDLNGWEFTAPRDEVVRFSLRIARGWERNLYRIKGWLRKRCSRLKDSGRPSPFELLLDALRNVDKSRLVSLVRSLGGLPRWVGRVPGNQGQTPAKPP